MCDGRVCVMSGLLCDVYVVCNMPMLYADKYSMLTKSLYVVCLFVVCCASVLIGVPGCKHSLVILLLGTPKSSIICE